jgi:hypothetical protein
MLDLSRHTGLILIRIFVIYLPTGFVAGVRARRADIRHPATLLPPALHALMAGIVLVVLHALFAVYVLHSGIGPPFEWLVLEGLVAVVFSTLAGLFGDLYATSHKTDAL